ncbi:glycosyltransferase, partial [Akkermansia sp.]
MNILHTIASLNTRSGGTSTCTYDLVKALNGNGCRTDILTLSPADASDVMIGQDSFIHALPNDAVSPLSLSRGMRGFLHGETEYDLYHTNGLWQDVNHATAAIARAKGKPCVISPHGMLYPEALLRSRWKKRLMLNLGHRRDLERADCIHVTCLREMKHCRALGLLNPMAVIPNPVAVPGFLEELNRPNDRFRIGFLGRFHPIKNIDRLIRAWSVAGKAAQDGELVLVGDGPAEYVSY